jgi:GH15 family glucan-1,4-alpha-glucosidase
MQGDRPAIRDLALLSDCRGAAMVDRAGSVQWWCPRRFDARACFARLLDPDGGHWSIRPAGSFEAERAYRPDTMVLDTTFEAAGGRVRLGDALALGPQTRGHDIGASSPHALVRVVEGLAGAVELELELAPRPEYGLAVPALVRTPSGLRSERGPDGFFLTTTHDLVVDGGTARARFTLRAGERAAFALQHVPGLSRTAPPPLDAEAALGDTQEGWRSWCGLHETYDGPYREAVRRSALILQALTYQPSGAIVAAPTTSLPEVIGGRSNWDYRYAWLRDASLTIGALRQAACVDEAGRYFQWILQAAPGCLADDHVQIVFGVEGERDLAERELDHLAGFAGSRPVRVGNAAWRQTQLDVYGEVLAAAHGLGDELELDELGRRFLAELADRSLHSLGEADHGIWESRDPPRRHVSSMLGGWLALDRAVQLAPRLCRDDRVAGWARGRDHARRAILKDAWNAERCAFVGQFDSDRLDASVLLIALYGLLDAGDARLRETYETLERELGEHGHLRRFTGAEDGAFLACTLWLAECWIRAGEPGRGQELMERALGCASDVGLLSEELDPATGEALGNTPQALSHVALINAACALARS